MLLFANEVKMTPQRYRCVHYSPMPSHTSRGWYQGHTVAQRSTDITGER